MEDNIVFNVDGRSAGESVWGKRLLIRSLVWDILNKRLIFNSMVDKLNNWVSLS